MTRDEARGQDALVNLEKYTQPQAIFVGSDREELYLLERRRSDIIGQCAKEWSKVVGVPKEKYWLVAVPQALHDTLESYQTECGIVACEAFLKRHGWTVTRPLAVLAKTG